MLRDTSSDTPLQVPQAEDVGRSVIEAIMQSRQGRRTSRPEGPKFVPPPRKGLRAILSRIMSSGDQMSRGDMKVLRDMQERRARDEALRSMERLRPVRRPRPPLYTEETAPLLTEEDIIRFGIERGYADGGMIRGYQEGGEIDQSTQQVTESFVSPEVAPAYAQLTDRIVNESMRPYQGYGGQRLAGFTAPETQAMRGMYQYGMGGGPAEMQMAQQSLMGAMGGYGGVGYQNQPGALQPYMSSYMQGVVDPQAREIRRESQRQGQRLRSDAGRAGALGGYRHGLGEQAIRMNTSQQIGDVYGAGRQQAFQNAQQAFASDQARRMAASQGLMGLGGAFGSLGGQQQNMQFDRYNQMMGAGQRARQMQQQSLDIGYQDFQNRMNQQRQNINWQLGAMGQLPYQSTTVQQRNTAQAGPSAGQRYLGTAVSGMGLYDQNKNNKPDTAIGFTLPSFQNQQTFDPPQFLPSHGSPSGIGMSANATGPSPLSMAYQRVSNG